MPKTWIAAALLLCSTLCMAQEKSVAIHGFDKMSCEDWFGSENQAEARQQYIAWIRGVVTGYNYANPGNQVSGGRMPSDFGLAVFVDNYCHSRRATSVAGAAFALIADRRGNAAVQIIDDQPTPEVRIDAKTGAKTGAESAAKSADKPAQNDETPGFHDWLARQSDDIKSLGVDLQRSIYRKEMALKER
ncbi:MAG TPA: hypothetical protein VF472_20910 [Burkholderiaceae bacterium]